MIPLLIESLKSNESGNAIAVAMDLRNRAGNPSGDLEQLEGRWCNSLRTTSKENVMGAIKTLSFTRWAKGGKLPSSFVKVGIKQF